MNITEMNDRGIINIGNISRIFEVMRKAELGQDITIGFLGGSITMGSLSSTPQTCYAYRVFEWWTKTFQHSNMAYVNAGIGATTSQFGLARVGEDLLRYKPDMVFVEYSVNDKDNELFQETFEGLVRKILESEGNPGVFMFNNVEYDTGHNAQRVHNEVGKFYQLPIVSMKESIYKEVVDGNIELGSITPDNLHPNDEGHSLVSGVIINLLKKIYEMGKANACNLETYQIPEVTYTKNRYYNMVRYNNGNATPLLYGFRKDATPQDGITDVFKNGWSASECGSSIEFEVEGSKISIQYRKSITQPAPLAKVVIDGVVSKSIILDANFDETWGDCIYLQDIYESDRVQKHKLRIAIEESDVKRFASDFYLISVIVVE
ncbi:MAG TPA: SGNH/GDSL hydrolase family protein [Lachnospiraceae bacterium]|nr:SGNH/GDSL hydrolase family protein [Lachnospiraceae bacterium]